MIFVFIYYPDIHTCMIVILITISTNNNALYITILTDQEALDIQHKKHITKNMHIKQIIQYQNFLFPAP